MTYRQFVKYVRQGGFTYKTFSSFERKEDSTQTPYFQLIFNIQIKSKGNKKLVYKKGVKTIYKAYNRKQLKNILTDKKKLRYIHSQLADIMSFII